MPTANWEDTQIFKSLDKPKEQNPQKNKMVTFLSQENVMPKIELILDKAATTPSDFTLHDSAHSFRVAERMWELIPIATQQNLSDYEKVFLLLSAYLHDIGMSPKLNTVERHRQFLMSNDKNCLSHSEIHDFQSWIDSNISNYTKLSSFDLQRDKIDDYKLVNLILKYYIRSRHNDWSEQWIRENLYNTTLVNYPGWQDDLIKVCKSHHYDINKLLKDDFNPVPVSNSIVHLRYIAMCLRLADVLENDPERTPDVLLRHRDINEDSINYWLKDHLMNISRVKDRYHLRARPIKSIFHKAILDTATYIENELRLCHQLKIERPLNNIPSGTADWYNWEIEPYLDCDIKPKDNCYEYIDGSFKPNIKRILGLLGGTQLYKDNIIAIRELLQNGFDSIKEKEAFGIFQQDVHSDQLRNIKDNNEIRISLSEEDSRYWLICKDSGAGMTRSIIENHFLQSGAGRRAEIIELGRKLSGPLYELEQTAQFGIGVLSYFMIAEKIIIRTKRAQNTGYNDDQLLGWEFELDGINDFGELKRTNINFTGTEIRLLLNKQIEKSISEWSNRIVHWLEIILQLAPCKVILNLQSFNKIKVFTPSWNQSYINESLLPSHIHVGNFQIAEDFISTTLIEANNKEEKRNSELVNRMTSCVKFLSSEGRLPNNQGKYIIQIPYFQLHYGNSLIFMYEEEIDGQIYVSDCWENYIYIPNFEIINFSYKGFKIVVNWIEPAAEDVGTLPSLNAHVQIDLDHVDTSELAVNRNEIGLKQGGEAIDLFLKEKYRELLEDHKRLFDNNYGFFNNHFLGLIFTTGKWLFYDFSNYPDQAVHHYRYHRNENPTLLLRDIEFPICIINNGDDLMNRLYQGKRLNVTPKSLYSNNFFQFNGLKNKNTVYQLGILMDENRISLEDNFELFAIIQHKEDLSKIEGPKGFGGFIELPLELDDVLFFIESDVIEFSENTLINRNGKFFNHFTCNSFKKISDTFPNIENSEILNSTDSLSYLIYAIKNYPASRWDTLIEHRGLLIERIFETLKLKNIKILSGSASIVIVTSKDWIEPYEDLPDQNITQLLQRIDSSYYLNIKES